VLASEPDAVDRMANQLRKMVGVSEVMVTPEAECVTREHALIRVRVSPADLAGLLDTVALFQASVVEESAHELLLQVAASPPILGSLLRALEPFGVLELARGGAIALARPAASDAGGGRVAPAASTVRVAAAIPA
jgi:acetolactate synthase I/III small subunit